MQEILSKRNFVLEFIIFEDYLVKFQPTNCQIWNDQLKFDKNCNS